MNFLTKWNTAIDRCASLLCVGLDPDCDKIPALLNGTSPAETITRFCCEIVDATSAVVSAYKPNLGFFLRWGAPGIEALAAILDHIPDDVPVILDCKVGDMGNTSTSYADGYFRELNVDAITANPYLGEEGLAPFLDTPGKAVFVLTRTSNQSSDLFQCLMVDGPDGTEPLFLNVAREVAKWDQQYSATAGLVVGATYPEDLQAIRILCPNLPILLPGVGAQGGNLTDSLKAGLDSTNRGLLISASRSILYASNSGDFARSARAAAEELNAQVENAMNAVRQPADPAPAK